MQPFERASLDQLAQLLGACSRSLTRRFRGSQRRGLRARLQAGVPNLTRRRFAAAKALLVRSDRADLVAEVQTRYLNGLDYNVDPTTNCASNSGATVLPSREDRTPASITAMTARICDAGVGLGASPRTAAATPL